MHWSDSDFRSSQIRQVAPHHFVPLSWKTFLVECIIVIGQLVVEGTCEFQHSAGFEIPFGSRKLSLIFPKNSRIRVHVQLESITGLLTRLIHGEKICMD